MTRCRDYVLQKIAIYSMIESQICNNCKSFIFEEKTDWAGEKSLKDLSRKYLNAAIIVWRHPL